jgi:hypothetical protein
VSAEVAARMRRFIEGVFERRRSLLGRVRGNFLIHVPEIATWTIVTQGPRLGLHDGATEDIVDFMIVCDVEILGSMFTDGFDPLPYLESGRLRAEGDAGIFSRFVALATPAKSAVALRAGV